MYCPLASARRQVAGTGFRLCALHITVLPLSHPGLTQQTGVGYFYCKMRPQPSHLKRLQQTANGVIITLWRKNRMRNAALHEQGAIQLT